MPREIQFSSTKPAGDCVFHVSEEDVRTVLARLPPDAFGRLRRVHFNNQSRGVRVLGYVTSGRREIAMCALPPRISLARFLSKGQSPSHFGARRGTQWPELAIRRFLLYDVFLNGLGRLQIIDERAASDRRKFAHETKAQEFAMYWCRLLWSTPFDHADPVHNQPSEAEMAELENPG